MENYKKGIGNNNCQSDIKFLRIITHKRIIHRELTALLMIISIMLLAVFGNTKIKQ